MKSVESINNELQEIGSVPLSYRGTEKELELLPEVLNEREKILFYTSGNMTNSAVWLGLCSNQRILFLKKGLFGVDQQSIQLERISSITQKKGMVFSGMHIWDGNLKIEFINVHKQAAQIFIDTVNNAIYDLKNSSNTTVIKQVESDDIATQLEKFASLLEKGLLTQEEFDIQKKALLGKTVSNDSSETTPIKKDSHKAKTSPMNPVEQTVNAGSTSKPEIKVSQFENVSSPISDNINIQEDQKAFVSETTFLQNYQEQINSLSADLVSKSSNILKMLNPFKLQSFRNELQKDINNLILELSKIPSNISAEEKIQLQKFLKIKKREWDTILKISLTQVFGILGSPYKHLAEEYKSVIIQLKG